MKEWINECWITEKNFIFQKIILSGMNKWMNEWMNEWVMNEWLIEWMNKYIK